MKAVVAAPCPLVGGLVVVDGVRPAVAAARAAVGAGAAGPGMRRRGAASAVALAAGLLPGALALLVGGLLAGVGAEAALAARVVGLAEAAPAGRAGAVDDAHFHRRSPLLVLGAGVAEQFVGAAAAAAGDRDDLGRGYGRAA